VSSGTELKVLFTAKEKAEFREEPGDPKPLEAGEVAGRTLASLISPGTELNSAYLGEKFPAQPGYAAVFEVDEAGAGVKDLPLGARVLCTGPNGIGGHKSRQRCPREAAVLLPQGLAPEVAVHARLMQVSMSTLTTTAARPPEKVLILGLGPVGHLAAQIFQSCGFQVIAVDPVESRRRLLQEKGVADVRAAAPANEKQLPDGIALALECSGHEQAAVDACRSVRKRGEVVLVGVPWKRRCDAAAFDLTHAVFRRMVVFRSGSEWEVARHPTEYRTGSVFGNIAAALRWLAEGRVRVDGLYEKVAPREAQRVYQDLLAGRHKTLSAVFVWAE
jgi:threonine dehydrogenase-like Zn-dependent dehydrogenase